MKGALVVLALSLAAGCAHMDRATLVASTATLACDWAQTRRAASEDWSGGRYETNPVMGTHPSTTKVDTYFATTVVGNFILWQFLPEGWRSAVPAAVTARQISAINHNIPTTGMCGL